MLKLIMVLLFALGANAARSQTILQLTEQLAIDAEKLSTLRSTLQDMKQGYAELEAGYTRIRDIVKDNFKLHATFLDALWVLSPAVREDPRLSTIISTEYRIVAAYQAATGRLGSLPVWTAAELD